MLEIWAPETAQWVRALATKPDTRVLVWRTHMVERTNPHRLSQSLHMHCMMRSLLPNKVNVLKEMIWVISNYLLGKTYLSQT